LTTPSKYGWVVVAAAFTLMFVGFAAAYSFAAFFSALEGEFGASRAHIALVFSVAAFLWFLLGAPGGMAADRFGPRRVAIVGVLSLAIGLWLASRAQSLGVLYATYSIAVGIGVGLVYVPSVGAVQPWFTRNRALASGLAIAGIGGGNIAGPLLAAWWIGLFGWRGAYAALAVFVLVLGGAAALAIRAKPGLAATRASSGVSLGTAVKTRPFWLLYASLVLTCIGLFVPMVHLGPYAQDAGYTEAQGEPGAMVVNYMNDDPKFDQYLQRLERAFGGAVMVLPSLYDPNIIAFAFRGAPASIAWSTLRLRAEKLEARYGLPFPRYISRLRAMNRTTADALLITE
jgi:MFS family permease